AAPGRRAGGAGTRRVFAAGGAGGLLGGIVFWSGREKVQSPSATVRLGRDHRTRARNVAPFAPRFLAASSQTPSASVTHDSSGVIAAAPKLPSVAPRSGISTFSVARRT